MKHEPNESFEKWAERVRMFEQGLAMQRIAKGEPTDRVLEDMARRIVEKLLHPVIKSLMPAPASAEEVEKGKQKYNEIMKNVGLKSDHVSDKDIDDQE
jgi:glutamyl-tRNA reductase